MLRSAESRAASLAFCAAFICSETCSTIPMPSPPCCPQHRGWEVAGPWGGGGRASRRGLPLRRLSRARYLQSLASLQCTQVSMFCVHSRKITDMKWLPSIGQLGVLIT